MAIVSCWPRWCRLLANPDRVSAYNPNPKTCTSIHLASVWAERGRAVCVVDADRNRSALAYGIRGSLPFAVVPVEAAAKATRHAEVELTVELAQLLRRVGVPHAVLMAKVDLRQPRAIVDARQALQSFGLQVLDAEVPLLGAFDKAETQGLPVSLACDDRGRADPRRMVGWSAYQSVAQEIECLISKPLSVVSRTPSPLPLSWLAFAGALTGSLLGTVGFQLASSMGWLSF